MVGRYVRVFTQHHHHHHRHLSRDIDHRTGYLLLRRIKGPDWQVVGQLEHGKRFDPPR